MVYAGASAQWWKEVWAIGSIGSIISTVGDVGDEGLIPLFHTSASVPTTFFFFFFGGGGGSMAPWIYTRLVSVLAYAIEIFYEIYMEEHTLGTETTS